MTKLQKVLIMAGGTGGHVFPGLAVAKAFQDQGIRVEWLGTQKGIESKLIPEANIPIHYISINGLRGKGLKEIIFAPFRLAQAIKQSLTIINKLQPDVVIGMGGFASGPGGIASWLLRKPLIVHEQNAKAGLTNKWLSRVATKVLQGFPETFSPSKKLVTTGNPVREEITAIPAPEKRFQKRREPLRLLVIGGSLGAASINELVPHALAKMPETKRPQVYHQSGEKHLQQTLLNYKSANVNANVVPFISDMAAAYQWADIVLCRAGALTIAELCAAGLGSILVPYPFAVDDHQTVNANYLVKHDAAIVIQQANLDQNKLIDLLNDFVESPAKRTAMATAAYRLRTTDATQKVLAICGEICN